MEIKVEDTSRIKVRVGEQEFDLTQAEARELRDALNSVVTGSEIPWVPTITLPWWPVDPWKPNITWSGSTSANAVVLHVRS